MALTRDELLVILIEECGEVIQAATKCLRFGWDRNQPNYGVNHEVLAQEVGDLLGMVDALPLNTEIREQYRRIKRAKAERVKREIAEKSTAPRREDWHYDSQGYCDNPGRGY